MGGKLYEVQCESSRDCIDRIDDERRIRPL